MEIEVGGGGSSVVVARANQNLRSLVVRYGNPGMQGFDLASGDAPGQFRAIRIYAGDEIAMAQARQDLRSAIGHALAEAEDGIFDSSIEDQPGMRVGMGRRVDVHGDQFWLMRPTVIGDLNLDGNVSIGDFIDLAAHFGEADSSWDRGDINYDGNVTIADFIELASHFGGSYSGEVVGILPEDQRQLTAFAAGNVPEPNS